MLVERAYRIYLHGCDLRNLGRVLRRRLNRRSSTRYVEASS